MLHIPVIGTSFPQRISLDNRVIEAIYAYGRNNYINIFLDGTQITHWVTNQTWQYLIKLNAFVSEIRAETWTENGFFIRTPHHIVKAKLNQYDVLNADNSNYRKKSMFIDTVYFFNSSTLVEASQSTLEMWIDGQVQFITVPTGSQPVVIPFESYINDLRLITSKNAPTAAPGPGLIITYRERM